jgi:hypothetical protein
LRASPPARRGAGALSAERGGRWYWRCCCGAVSARSSGRPRACWARWCLATLRPPRPSQSPRCVAAQPLVTCTHRAAVVATSPLHEHALSPGGGGLGVGSEARDVSFSPGCFGVRGAAQRPEDPPRRAQERGAPAESRGPPRLWGRKRCWISTNPPRFQHFQRSQRSQPFQHSQHFQHSLNLSPHGESILAERPHRLPFTPLPAPPAARRCCSCWRLPY